MPRTRSLALATCLLAAGSGCAEWTLPVQQQHPSEPEVPDDPGKPPEPPGAPVVYLADADGSNLRLLVAGDRPAWSPDGGRIAFQRNGQVRVIGVDGTGETALGPGSEPAWSPDGAHIVFAGEDGIMVMRDDGTAVTLLLPHGFRNDTWAEGDMGVGKPAWSRGGDRIAFEHRGDGDVMPAQVFVMNPDGSAPRRVTPTTGYQYAESDPSWSPDGTELVFWSFGYGIAAAPPGSGQPRRIYENFPAVAYGARPAWSPDGRTILFTANRFSAEGSSIWDVPAAGGEARVLIPGGADPAWSPDGARIAFSRVQAVSSRSRLSRPIGPEAGSSPPAGPEGR